jgi:hypothetical protein
MTFRKSKKRSRQRRLEAQEEAKGAGAVNVEKSDGSTEGFHLTQKQRLKVLIASLDIANAAGNPEAKSESSPRAIQIAHLIAEAEQVTPPSRLWDTIAGTIQNAERNAEEDKRDGNKGDSSHYIQEDKETK